MALPKPTPIRPGPLNASERATLRAMEVALKRGNERDRLKAVEALGAFGKTHAIKELERAAKKQSFSIGQYAVQQLGRYAHPRAVRALARLTQSGSRYPYDAVCALSRTRHEDAIQPILDYFNDKPSKTTPIGFLTDFPHVRARRAVAMLARACPTDEVNHVFGQIADTTRAEHLPLLVELALRAQPSDQPVLFAHVPTIAKEAGKREPRHPVVRAFQTLYPFVKSDIWHGRVDEPSLVRKVFAAALDARHAARLKQLYYRKLFYRQLRSNDDHLKIT